MLGTEQEIQVSRLRLAILPSSSSSTKDGERERGEARARTAKTNFRLPLVCFFDLLVGEEIYQMSVLDLKHGSRLMHVYFRKINGSSNMPRSKDSCFRGDVSININGEEGLMGVRLC